MKSFTQKETESTTPSPGLIVLIIRGVRVRGEGSMAGKFGACVAAVCFMS